MESMNKKAAVIGSGFGGLALAIRMQASGIQTTIFEKRDMAGGRAYVYKDAGFVFDAGPTLITAPECLEELFTVAGKKMADYVNLVPIKPFYRLAWDDGYFFDYSNDEKETYEQIRKKSPEDVEGFKRFMKYSEDVYGEGYTKLVAAAFPNFFSMIRVAPQLMRLQAYRSVYSMVSKYIKDTHLRQAFSFHPLLIGGNPFRASSIYTLINYLERTGGVWFAMGGTGALIQGLVRLFEDIGGKIRFNSEVDEVQCNQGRIEQIHLKGGYKESFDLVASNADVLHTYQHIFRNENVLKSTTRRLEKMDYSMSLFLIYFGTKKKYDNIPHHMIMFGPRYKALLKDIFSNGVLADDFSLYLHRPTCTDPSLAPPGCDSFYVLSPVPHLGKTGSTIDWNVEAPKYADKIFQYMEAKYLPDLRKNLVTTRYMTPLDFKTDLNSPMGSAFSLEPTLLQSAYFRSHNRDKKVRGFYLVGAGTHPGAGIPGVVNSGKATFGVIQEDLKAGVFN
jgi:phytoene desaturase